VGQDAVQPAGCPPVVAAEEEHRGRDDEEADHRGVDDSKEQLLLELLTTRVSDRIGAVAEILEGADAGDDPLGELSRLLMTVADRNAEFVALQAEFWVHAVRNPEFMAAIAGQFR
jgi:hypothetical protein